MRIEVYAHPKAKQSRIEKTLEGEIHVYVKEPPEDGKANRAAVVLLADYFNVSKSMITLISGQKSRFKVFEIQYE